MYKEGVEGDSRERSVAGAIAVGFRISIYVE